MSFTKQQCKLCHFNGEMEKNNGPISNGHGMRILLLLSWGDVRVDCQLTINVHNITLYSGVKFFERTMPMVKTAYLIFCEMSLDLCIKDSESNIHTSMGWHATRQFSSFETLWGLKTIVLFILFFFWLAFVLSTYDFSQIGYT